MLAIKGNQDTLYKDFIDYFKENDFKKILKVLETIKKGIPHTFNTVQGIPF